MRALLACGALTLAVLAAGCSGQSSSTANTSSGEGALASFTGEWKATGHIVAPWATGPGFLPEPDGEILEKPLVITQSSTAGPAILACEVATFDLKSLPLAGLFEGNVSDPYLAKAALGIEQDMTPTLLEGCTSGGSDKELSYHLIGKDRLLLGLDNIVYQFDRAAATTAKP